MPEETTADGSNMDHLLTHPIRRAVYDHVHEDPGTYPARIADILERDASTVHHHVDRLADGGLVIDERCGRCRHLFPSDGMPPMARTVAVALHRPVQRDVLLVLAEADDRSLTELAERVDRAVPTVHHHVATLVEAGLVVDDATGRSRRLALTEAAERWVREHGTVSGSTGSEHQSV